MLQNSRFKKPGQHFVSAQLCAIILHCVKLAVESGRCLHSKALLPLVFPAAISARDPVRANEIDTLLDQHKVLQNQRKRPKAAVWVTDRNAFSCGLSGIGFEVRYEQWALLKTIKQSEGSFCAKLSLSISVLQRKRSRSDAGKNRGGSRLTAIRWPRVIRPAP